MKYHDSIIQAEQKMNMAVKELQRWCLPVSPINYAVSYEYINKKNIPLNKTIENQLTLGKKLDNFFIEENYRQYILGQSNFRDEIIDELEEVVTHVEKNNQKSSLNIDTLITNLDNNIDHLQSSDKETAISAANSIRHASQAFKLNQQKFAEHISLTCEKTRALQVELKKARKEIYMDPLTGLYNRKAMSKHLDLWLTQDPNRQVAAILVNVNQLSEINTQFGHLISDVLLSKIASKVNSYVDDSGLPIRSGGDEFLILLPDVDKASAREIADKISQGVEKLRFVSSKSGVRLPKMTLSIGVEIFNIAENANNILKKARRLLPDYPLDNNVLSF
ncbi:MULTISPECIES: GGDEF domain-containing protein [unclassified Colwellia]|uniref:GGDEF domain-containing protein n=1 Tax=unclassified Colwellia TaxID=196834 RepID=UPI0015F662C5|nr:MULTISPECIES: GGDEF domain-containing protein [unclassified Colwellia]MBA6231231.1 GGDEF domain-containing protein [Colwellia sp. MB02u-7]MBA6238339.1 GGDEF domain-containing protein [Colwellia sp. MB02u-11]MBA6255113.1 GGDEF domain-containing protein [Colwellia sp. MB3u-28]MBA6260688.1 GGDEF domain-containing protein [Colwellia sp. MB3u-41]MBA6299060.1 GGDEF domain-containing protein [Colwellia sp. MB3u-22]